MGSEENLLKYLPPLQILADELSTLEMEATINWHQMKSTLKRVATKMEIMLDLQQLTRYVFKKASSSEAVFDWAKFIQILNSLDPQTDPSEALCIAIPKARKHFVNQKLENVWKSTKKGVLHLSESIDQNLSSYLNRLHHMCFVFLGGEPDDLFEKFVPNKSNASLKPITEIGVMTMKKGHKVPEGKILIDETVEGRSACLNSSGAKDMFLYYKRGENKAPITAITIINIEDDEEPPLGFQKVYKTLHGEDADLSRGQGLHSNKCFLCYKRGDGAPLLEIDIISKRKSERTREGFHEILRTPRDRVLALDSGRTLITVRHDHSRYVAEKFQKHLENAITREEQVLARCVACLAAGLFAYHSEVYVKSLEGFTSLWTMRDVSPLLVEDFIECIWQTQALYVSFFGSTPLDVGTNQRTELRSPTQKLLKWVRNFMKYTYYEITTNTFMCLVMICAFQRHEDSKQETCKYLLDSVMRKVKSKWKPRTSKPRLNPPASNKTDSSFDLSVTISKVDHSSGPEVVEGVLTDLLQQVDLFKKLSPAMKRYKTMISIDSKFRREMSNIVDRCFLHHHERILVGAFMVLAKASAQDLPDQITGKSEIIKRRIHCLKLCLAILQKSKPFFRSSLCGSMILRYFFAPSYVQSLITSIPPILTVVQEIYELLWNEYREVLKFELGVCLEIGYVGMLQNSYAVAHHKIHLINSLGNIFRRPEYLVDLYYNFDNNEDGDWRVCQSLMEILAEICNEPIKNDLDRNLTLTTLKLMSKLMQLLAKHIHVPGLVQVEDNIIQSQSNIPGMMSRFSREDSISVTANSLFDASVTDRTFTSISHDPTQIGVVLTLDDPLSCRHPHNSNASTVQFEFRNRSNTWTKRNEKQKERRKLLEDTLKIARAEKVKTAIKHLKKSGGKKWGNIEQVASFLYEYQEQLNTNQVSEFLASKSSSVYTKEEHCELRELWGKHIDFTGFDFEKAWRHFLLDCGVLIAGLEGQAVERMMELFAVMFCRDNSGIFTSTDPAFQLAFVLLMVQTEVTNPNLQPSARMSRSQFLDILRQTDPPCPLSDELLTEYFRSIQSDPLDISVAHNYQHEEHTVENKFRSVCINLTHKAQAKLKRYSTSLQKFQSSRHTSVVVGLYEILWEAFFAALTRVMQTSKDVELLSVCLDCIRFGAGTMIKLNLHEEAEHFMSVFARLLYVTEHQELTPEEVNGNLVRGLHLSEEWYTKLQRMRVIDGSRACAVFSKYVVNLHSRINYDSVQDILRQKEAIFEGEVYIVHPERKFIRKGTLRKLSSKGVLIEYTVFLFNDILIYGAIKDSRRGTYKHHRTLHLSLCSIHECNSPSLAHVRAAFEIRSPQKNAIFICKTEQEKNIWKHDMKYGINQILIERERWVATHSGDAAFTQESMEMVRLKSNFIGRIVSPPQQDISRRASLRTAARKGSFKGDKALLIDVQTRRPPCKLSLKPFGYMSSKKKCGVCQDVVMSREMAREKLSRKGRRFGRVCNACWGLLNNYDHQPVQQNDAAHSSSRLSPQNSNSAFIFRSADPIHV